MLLRSPWTPRLADIEASLAERLALALADDIIEGRLKAGDRLPAHRDLAWALGVGLGTVTKAYAALERRGLTGSIKGRGTFVTIRQARDGRQIDLASNAPPAMLTARLLARTLTRIARTINADHLNLYAPPAGHLEHRYLLARWLETLGAHVDPLHLVLTSNARQAISLAFDLACGPQGIILTERITYPGAIALARRKGFQMRGVEIELGRNGTEGAGRRPCPCEGRQQGRLRHADASKSDHRDHEHDSEKGYYRDLSPGRRLDHRRWRLCIGIIGCRPDRGIGPRDNSARKRIVEGPRSWIAHRCAGTPGWDDRSGGRCSSGYAAGIIALILRDRRGLARWRCHRIDPTRSPS